MLQAFRKHSWLRGGEKISARMDWDNSTGYSQGESLCTEMRVVSALCQP